MYSANQVVTIDKLKKHLDEVSSEYKAADKATKDDIINYFENNNVFTIEIVEYNE